MVPFSPLRPRKNEDKPVGYFQPWEQSLEAQGKGVLNASLGPLSLLLF